MTDSLIIDINKCIDFLEGFGGFCVYTNKEELREASGRWRHLHQGNRRRMCMYVCGGENTVHQLIITYTRSTNFALCYRWMTSDPTPILLNVLYLPPLCSWWAHCTAPSQSGHWLSHCTEMYAQSPHDLSCRTWKFTCRTTAWVLHSYSYILPVHEGILLFVVGSSQPLTDINCICHWTVCADDNNHGSW